MAFRIFEQEYGVTRLLDAEGTYGGAQCCGGPVGGAPIAAEVLGGGAEVRTGPPPKSADSSVGNRLDFHNQSSVSQNQSMIICIIGSWDAIFKIPAHGCRTVILWNLC